MVYASPLQHPNDAEYMRGKVKKALANVMAEQTPMIPILVAVISNYLYLAF